MSGYVGLHWSRQVIKEDLQLMQQDWWECYGILCDLYGEDRFSTKWFSLEQYLAAKTLVFSRAFEVDYVHGYGMVPLADLYALFSHSSFHSFQSL